MKRKKVSTYAREKGVSTQAVYAWIREGKVESEKIDGVTFIIVNDE